MSASPVPAAVIQAAADEARGFLRMEGTAEAALLARLAASALLLGEAFTGTAFVRRAQEDVLATRAEWQALAATPVAAITGVTALPVGAAPFVLAADRYAIDIDPDGGGWVRVTPAIDAARVAVSYSAGLAATWDALPAPLTHGVVLLIAHLFDRRDADAQPPAAVAALWRPYRRMRLQMGMRA